MCGMQCTGVEDDAWLCAETFTPMDNERINEVCTAREDNASDDHQATRCYNRK